MRKLLTTAFVLLLSAGTGQVIAATNDGNTVSKATETVEATVTIPEEITIAMADNPDSIEITVSTDASWYLGYSFATWTVTDESGATNDSIISKVLGGCHDKGCPYFTGKTGTVYVTAEFTLRDSLRTKIGTYTSNRCKVTVTPPVKPVTSMKYSQDLVEEGLYYSHPKSGNEPSLIITPADATFTAVNVETTSDNSYLIDGKLYLWDSYAAEGELNTTATYAYDSTVTASYKVVVKCQKPVTEIKLNGSDTIEVEPYTLVDLPDMTVTPEDADVFDFNGYSFKYIAADPNIAYWHRPRSYINAITHGETSVTVEAADQKGAQAQFMIKVKEPDRTAYNGYEDGALILSGCWYYYDFGGVINHLTADATLMYRVFERENHDMAFGRVERIASYGGNIYVKSDGVSQTPRFYNLDNSTSAYTGAMPTTTEAITVLDGKTLKKIDGMSEADDALDAKISPNKLQVGKYRFVLDGWREGRNAKYYGLRVYDVETGDTVKTVNKTKTTFLEDGESIVQLANGKIWFRVADANRLIDPETLEVEDCAFEVACADPKNNVVWSNGGTELYRYDIDTGESRLLFSTWNLPCQADTITKKVRQLIGCVAFDSLSCNLIVATTEGRYTAVYEQGDMMSTNNEYSYVYIIDAATGELKKSVPMRKYYWNNLMAIVPDKCAPEFINVENSVTIGKEDPALTIDLTDKVTDKDNIDYNIVTPLSDSGDASIAAASLNGKTLTITPVAVGETTVTLMAESNGVTTTHDIAVKVVENSAVNAVSADANNAVTTRYSVSGQRLTAPQRGVNIVRSQDGKAHKVNVK